MSDRNYSILITCAIVGFVMFAGLGCEPDPSARTVEPPPSVDMETDALTEDSQPVELEPSLLERLKNEKWIGDLDGLKERRYIRALVLYNKTNFFYDGPQPRGVTYEAIKEFEKFLNAKLETGNQPVYMVFIPVNREEMYERMTSGRGDIAASNIAITPEFKQKVDFSDPVRSDVKEVVVTGPSGPEIATLDDLAGKEVYVRKLSRYWPNLERLNARFKQSGMPEIILKEADPNLEDEDILDMVNAGVVGITVMDDLVAEFWSKVHDRLTVHSDAVLAEGDQIGWATQKGTPQFQKLINEFVAGHKVGTAFGNTILQRYLKDIKRVKNNTTVEEMEKFTAAVGFFKKYGGEYDFDWLMLEAQAYQESGIDQSRRSNAGAVGVMQIKPSTAADKSINVHGVEDDMEKNINAGVKYLRYVADLYFKDPKIKKQDKTLFAFAAYNAGPARVSQLRKQAEAEGLDPNVWFNNVEIIAAQRIGSETVTYVSNIYKYYVAYKMVAHRPSGARV